jgi:hypothetical protein
MAKVDRFSVSLSSKFSGELMAIKRGAWISIPLLGLASVLSLPAQAQIWDFLGHTKIDSARDHDLIHVTRRNGAFHTIQLRVSGDAIFFDRVVVHFADGTSEESAIRDRVWPGGRNRVIGLSGERRAVESVELWYYREPWGHNPSVILYGSY